MRSTLNFGIRGLFLVCRLLLIAVGARLLNPEDYGMLLLLSSLIALGIYVVGLEIYNYTLRETIFRKRAAKQLFVEQFVTQVLVFLPLLCIALLLLPQQLLPAELRVTFALLLFLEHQNQEFYRLLTALGRPVAAAFLHLLRGGLWVPPGLLLLILDDSHAGLSLLLTCWTTATLIVFAVHIRLLMQLPGTIHRLLPGKETLKDYFAIGTAYLVGAVFLQACFHADKPILAGLYDSGTVALYGFYASLAYAITTLVEASAVSIEYPTFVDGVRTGRASGLRQAIRFTSLILVVNFLCVLALLLIMPYLLGFIGNEHYEHQMPLLLLLIGAQAIYCLHFVPHYFLYALREDRLINIINVVTGVVFLAAGYAWAAGHGPIGIAWALLVAFTTALVAKSAFCFWRVGCRSFR